MYRYEPNDKITWRKIRRRVRSWLNRYYHGGLLNYHLLIWNGNLKKYIKINKFKVFCNGKINSSYTIDKGRCFCKVVIPKLNVDVIDGY